MKTIYQKLHKKLVTCQWTVTQTINSLHKTIKKLNKSECPSSKKHRILIIGDSHIRGLASSLNSLLNSNCDLSIVKPGSKSNELKETPKEKIRQPLT